MMCPRQHVVFELAVVVLVTLLTVCGVVPFSGLPVCHHGKHNGRLVLTRNNWPWLRPSRAVVCCQLRVDLSSTAGCSALLRQWRGIVSYNTCNVHVLCAIPSQRHHIFTAGADLVKSRKNRYSTAAALAHAQNILGARIQPSSMLMPTHVRFRLWLCLVL